MWRASRPASATARSKFPAASDVLTFRGITKRFGATVALDDVTLSIAAGDVVGLVGENGAGKTTLMRIAAGELRPDRGSVEAPSRIGFVHQHFAIVPQLTVAENLALLDRTTFRFVTRRTVAAEAERMIAASGIALPDVTRRAGDLSIGEKAKLELIKAIAGDPELLILDEPTSVLTPTETDELFGVIRRVAANGTAVVLISHKVREVLAIARRVVVMRRGSVVADDAASEVTAESVANAMVGSSVAPRADAATAGTAAVNSSSPPLLDVRDLVADILRGVSFTVRRGETVVIAGVAGNGQSELAALLRGTAKPKHGSIGVDTDRVGFIPEDRTRDGVVAAMSIAENIALGARRWSRSAATTRAEELIETYRIRATGPRQLAGNLSGGNQQKVVLARELDRKPELIIAAEPTRGLDIGSASFVHEELRRAAAAGAGLLIITSDLDEAFALADTVYVIYRGTLTEPLTPAAAAANVGSLMAGVR